MVQSRFPPNLFDEPISFVLRTLMHNLLRKQYSWNSVSLSEKTWDNCIFYIVPPRESRCECSSPKLWKNFVKESYLRWSVCDDRLVMYTNNICNLKAVLCHSDSLLVQSQQSFLVYNSNKWSFTIFCSFLERLKFCHRLIMGMRVWEV